MKKKIELLAPAGGLEQLKAAVLNGADAVYFGGNAFSARQSAKNFSLEEIEVGRRLTAQYGVKMYCAINTLLSKKEVEEALVFIDVLNQIGIDGIIVQDIGLMALCLTHCPEMAVHTSTQMTVANVETIAYLKEQNVKRVVVPRESSLEDIKAMAKGGLELEAFVHGAICICYSGQCLLSSMIGGRSGNKGACAQPCRLTYDLVEGEDVVASKAHYLSPKDLMLIESVHAMIEAGVTSFKIEGRMKTPAYVAETVKYYREAIDAYEKGVPYSLKKDERQNIEEVFNRDFTEGYLKGIKDKDLMSYRKPNHRGVFLGRVVDYDNHKATINLKHHLDLGDKIAFWTKKDGRVVTEVGKIIRDNESVTKGNVGETVLIDVPKRIGREDRVFKVESSLRKRLLAEAMTTLDGQDKIGIKAIFKGDIGEPLELTLVTESGLTVSSTSDLKLEKAIHHPLDEAILKGQMRLGNTPYVLTALINDIAPDAIVPKSTLNQMRRQCIEALDASRVVKEKRIPITLDLLPKNNANIEVEVTVSSIDQMKLALEKGVEKVFYPLISFKGMGENLLAYLKNKPETVLNKIGLVLPRIVREEELPVLEAAFKAYSPYINSFKANTLDQLVYLKNRQVPHISGSSHLNIFNPYAFKALKGDFSADGLSLSRERNIQGLSEFKGHGSLLVYGSLPLMVLEHCVIKGAIGCESQFCGNKNYGLKDRKNIIFPIKTDGLCKTHLFNSKTLFIAEDVEALYKKTFNHFELDFTLDTAAHMNAVLEAYLFLFSSLEAKKSQQVKKAVDSLKAIVTNYTKGHYHRGVN